MEGEKGGEGRKGKGGESSDIPKNVIYELGPDGKVSSVFYRSIPFMFVSTVSSEEGGGGRRKGTEEGGGGEKRRPRTDVEFTGAE